MKPLIHVTNWYSTCFNRMTVLHYFKPSRVADAVIALLHERWERRGLPIRAGTNEIRKESPVTRRQIITKLDGITAVSNCIKPELKASACHNRRNNLNRHRAGDHECGSAGSIIQHTVIRL